jgi:hypothetical protein
MLITSAPDLKWQSQHSSEAGNNMLHEQQQQQQ